MLSRERIERGERERLAPWGSCAGDSAGRRVAEDEHPYRTAFQRDRDRVVHARAFRRLQYKTQVFIAHEGDHFRNRLTHTLEVAQIARTAARALGANEDLTEAIVLAHDLGHTPFGHSGERALHRLMKEHGGFEHNRQSIRIVDFLEIRSPHYRGLNLCEETRAGILKHGSDGPAYPHPVALPALGRQARVEAQIADAADEIAYHNHDLDDGLRSGLIEWDDLANVTLWVRVLESARKSVSPEDRRVLRARAVALLIDMLVTDLIETSHARLEDAGRPDAAEVTALPAPVVRLSDEMERGRLELARFLRERLYNHYRVVRMARKAGRILDDLWQAYHTDPRQVPPRALEGQPGEPRERAIADYLAGMTDRYAMEEHAKLFDPTAPV